jgi:hypothetical protein
MAASSIPLHDVIYRVAMDAEIVGNSDRWDAQRSLPQDLFCDLVLINHAIIIHIFLQFCTKLDNFAQVAV